MTQSLPKGTIVQVIVGLPGPDVVTGIVVEPLAAGGHRLLCLRFISGEIYETTHKGVLFPDIPWKGQFKQDDADRLRSALKKMGE